MSEADVHQSDRKQGWVKRTAAILGIAATVVTVLTGLVALYLQIQSTLISIEEQRSVQQEAIKGAEEAKEGAEVARLEQKKVELKIAREQNAAASRQLVLEIKIASEVSEREKEKQDSILKIEQMKVKQLEIPAQRQEQEEIFRAISKLVDEDKPAL